jgi:hypothetical protein
MSLPVRRPVDEHAPIIRQDGQYTLVINPKPVVETVDGEQWLRSLGVPYGSLGAVHVVWLPVRRGGPRAVGAIRGRGGAAARWASGFPGRSLFARGRH